MNEQFLINLREQLHLLPANLAHHLKISALALAAGAAVTLPLGVLVARRARLRYPTLTFVSVIQTIPSLALLALMVPVLIGLGVLTEKWFGVTFSALGFWPTVIALTLYSMLPMVRNTVTGLLGVDPAATEAAAGVGMTPRQSLWRVQLPLAAPVILAGVRTATVWVVGIATLSTPVGQRSLGNFIFRGLQTRNWVMVLVGCVSAALLAVLLDTLLGGLARAVERRNRPAAGLCAGALAAVLALGLAWPMLVSTRVAAAGAGHGDPAAPARVRRDPIRIGAKTFTEQYILAALIEQTLRDAGLPTRRRESLGSTVVFDALVAGELDVYIDYSGTIWANHMKRDGSAPPGTVLAEASWWLASRHGIRCLGPLGFENSYALAMRRQDAQRLDVRTIDDLTPHAAEMKIAGDYEFFGRPEWLALRNGYHLRFVDQVSFDSTFMYAAIANREVEVIAAFSSDGRLEAYDLVTLADPRQVIPPYDAVLLLGPAVADDPAVAEALRPLLRAVPVETMRRANHMVDRDEDKRTIIQAAQWLAGQIAGTPAAPAP